MERFILKIFSNALAFYIAILIFPGIHAGGIFTPLWAGIVLAIIQITLRPVLVIILSPFIFLTVGLFTLIINTWMVMLSAFIAQIKIPGFWLCLVVALCVTVLNLFVKRLRKVSTI
jgi:Predicted membrane protein